ncbi:MAG TPA: serine hydrolase domain-containing protein [Dongiaceae bacterium]
MVQGSTDARFVKLRDAFESCFTDGLEHGASVAVVADGKPVVDLWGGHADAAKTRPWQRDTLVNVWSVTKGVVALAVAMLVERGKLAYDAPIAKVWPEFAANGKDAITLDLAMSHQAGLNGLSVPMGDAGLYAWFPYVEALAAMAPLWEPGSRCAYHAISYGHLAGETMRRADGRTPGRFIAEEIAGPLGVPFFVGLPESEDRRVAAIIAGPKTSDWLTELKKGDYPHSTSNPELVAERPNDRAWRAAEIPGANGHATAGALAKIYGMMASGGMFDGRRLISREGIAAATRTRFRGPDISFGTPSAFGAGFQLDEACYGSRASAGSFGHTGWGGSMAFADPGAGIGFAFLTCRMLGFDDGNDPRRERLVEAIYDCL